MNMQDEYFKFAESEQHFNKIQSDIRTQAGHWILAAFGAIALLLKTDVNGLTWLVSPPVLIGVVCCMATVGLLVLWINDQMVYQQLLNSVFIAAMKMEYHNKHLPPIRILALYKDKGKGLSRRMMLFYIVPMLSFLVITLATALLLKPLSNTSKVLSEDTSRWVLIVLCIVQVCVIGWILFQKNKVGASTLAPAFRDPEFESLFGNTTKEDEDKVQKTVTELVKRYKPVPDTLTH